MVNSGTPKQRSAVASARKSKRAKPAASAAPEGLQIGARVKHARLLAGIRMRELAEKVGCTESMVSKIEAGRVVPSLQMLQRLERGSRALTKRLLKTRRLSKKRESRLTGSKKR